MLLRARMPATEKRTLRHVVDALVNDDRVDPSHAEDAVARVLAKAPALAMDALELYRAARRSLRIDSVPPVSSEFLHTPVQPVRAPPPRRGTRRDTPAAKKSR